jgi:hypothetical protein
VGENRGVGLHYSLMKTVLLSPALLHPMEERENFGKLYAALQ